MGCELSWQDCCISKMTYKSSKLGQTDLILLCDQSLSVGLCIDDCKFVRVAVMICAVLVNTHTHTHTHAQTDSY